MLKAGAQATTLIVFSTMLEVVAKLQPVAMLVLQNFSRHVPSRVLKK
jgi:hypothetical protein